jgi:ankyrin repeat protein
MRHATLVLVTLLFTSTPILAQTPSTEAPPIEVEYPNIPQLLTQPIAIHADDEPFPPGFTPIQKLTHSQDRIFGNMVSVTLDVVINQNGRVESAHAVQGPERFYAQAEDIALHRAYMPARINGNVARVRFQNYVSIYPKERWSDHPIPFPEHPDLSTLKLSLQRSHCYGSCPSYTVTLSGNGDITFEAEGQYNFVAVPGTHHAHISPAAVLDLLQRFRSANFLSALDTYACNSTDLPSQVLTLSLNGISKKIIDYGGSVVGLPDAIEALEASVDDVTDTPRWVHGDANTLPSLQSESWNFASPSSQNIALFNSTIVRNDTDLIHVFLSAKAPILSADPKLVSPICTASGSGNRDLVQQMLDLYPQTKFNQLTRDECLSLAIRRGSVPLVDLWLTRGARSTFPPRPKDDGSDPFLRINPPLISAIQSGNPEVVALLLQHHAGVASKNNDNRNLPSFLLAYSDVEDDQKLQLILSLLIDAGASVTEDTDQDRPAIFWASAHPAVIPLLLKAGASLDQRDSEGKTPLMIERFSADGIDNLLKAGADPTLKTPDGTTALSEARKANCTRCVDILEAALKKRPDATAIPFVP